MNYCKQIHTLTILAIKQITYRHSFVICYRLNFDVCFWAHLKNIFYSQIGVCVSLSVVSNYATPWIVACQDPLSMRFPRQENSSGLPFPSPEGSSCFARCLNPRAGREKASKTMQLAKKGKFITDSNQGSCRASNTVVRGQRALSRGSYPNL